MTGWVALLRGVNVGGNNKVPMAELKALCEGLGLEHVQTYIASGNVAFASTDEEADLRGRIEQAIAAAYGRKLGVLVRSARDLALVMTANPFPDAPGNRVLVLFTDAPATLDGVRNQADEELAAGPRCVFVRYGEGMAQSRLQVPAAVQGTGRNMNTVARLAAMAAERD